MSLQKTFRDDQGMRNAVGEQVRVFGVLSIIFSTQVVAVHWFTTVQSNRLVHFAA
jgi:hypothetical protein